MNISCRKMGVLKCNCYLLEKNCEYLIIDHGDDILEVLEFIGDKNVIGILITHGHFDHNGCVSSLVKKTNTMVYDVSNLKEGVNNIGSFSFEVIYTFGHTMDSICFYFRDDKVMFTGDFLFNNTIGRCDLKESNYDYMLKSIDKIKSYDDDIVIYPGHGISTILGIEKKNNPYF